MGLFDKVKDFFTEPVEDGEEEIKVEQIKKEVTRVTPTPVIEKKRERVVEEEPTEEEVLKEAVEEEQPIRRERVKTPVFFTADDFADLEPEKPKKIEKKEKKKLDQ